MIDLALLVLGVFEMVVKAGYVCEQPEGWQERVMEEVVKHNVQRVEGMRALIVREAKCKPTRSARL